MATSVRIAVDAMGGDFAPRHVVAGAVDAARRLSVRPILVGRVGDVEAELERLDRSARSLVELVDAPEVVGMDEPALTPIRRKKLSSIRIAAELVRDGRAAALVSAGNTGAVMATAKLRLGTLDGVDRPALAAVLPHPGGVSVMLDAGANVECRPEHLAQFAVMGHVYARTALGIERPRVGVLSVGEEEGKGTELTREAYRVLKGSSLRFIGNVEGRHLFSGEADVVVTDGFTGNVALKASESAAEALGLMLRQELDGDWLARLGALAARHALRRFRRRIDYDEYGGAPLLGLKDVVIICHGRSSPKAIRNAIRIAAELVTTGSNDRINEGIRSLTGSSARAEAR